MAKTRKTKTKTKSSSKFVEELDDVKVEEEVEEPQLDDDDDEPRPKAKVVRKVATPEPRAEVSLKEAAKLVYMGETYFRGRKYTIIGNRKIDDFKKNGRFFVVDLES